MEKPLGRYLQVRSYQIFKKGGAWQDLNFEREVAEKEGGNFFPWEGGEGVGLQIYKKKQKNN